MDDLPLFVSEKLPAAVDNRPNLAHFDTDIEAQLRQLRQQYRSSEPYSPSSHDSVVLVDSSSSLDAGSQHQKDAGSTLSDSNVFNSARYKISCVDLTSSHTSLTSPVLETSLSSEGDNYYLGQHLEYFSPNCTSEQPGAPYDRNTSLQELSLKTSSGFQETSDIKKGITVARYSPESYRYAASEDLEIYVPEKKASSVELSRNNKKTAVGVDRVVLGRQSGSDCDDYVKRVEDFRISVKRKHGSAKDKYHDYREKYYEGSKTNEYLKEEVPLSRYSARHERRSVSPEAKYRRRSNSQSGAASQRSLSQGGSRVPSLMSVKPRPTTQFIEENQSWKLDDDDDGRTRSEIQSYSPQRTVDAGGESSAVRKCEDFSNLYQPELVSRSTSRHATPPPYIPTPVKSLASRSRSRQNLNSSLEESSGERSGSEDEDPDAMRERLLLAVINKRKGVLQVGHCSDTSGKPSFTMT